MIEDAMKKVIEADRESCEGPCPSGICPFESFCKSLRDAYRIARKYIKEGDSHDEIQDR